MVSGEESVLEPDVEECCLGVIECPSGQTAEEWWQTINEVAPVLLSKVHGRQDSNTLAEQMVFCFNGEYQIGDWQFSDPSVALPERQSDDDPVMELLASDVVSCRMDEAENWVHVYGVPLESISPLNGEEIDRLVECLQRVYDLHFPEIEQETEGTPAEDENTIPEEPVEDATVTADWLFKNFRETIRALQVTDQQRVNLFQPILVTLLCDGFSDASCRHEFIKWLAKFVSRFE